MNQQRHSPTTAPDATAASTTLAQDTKAVERPFIVKPLQWLWCLLPVVLWIAVELSFVDTVLFKQINRATHKLPDLFWVFFNMLGNGWGVFALLSPLLLIAPRALIATLFAGGLAGLLSRSLKVSLQFPRPASVLDETSFHIVGNPLTSLAMPSGHTLTAFAIATALYFSIAPTRRQYAVWLFVLASLAGLARIAVGAHWPADVFAGMSIGLFSGMVGVTLAKRLPLRQLAPQAWLMRAACGGAALCVYMLLTERLDFEETRPFQYLAAILASASIIWFVRQTLRPVRPLASFSR